ncbi:hypothetical protein F4821DRAFT_110976 [Hypoxylon rubiginosum]|uniref:Uncharacterized protein n=1 Tax=Hypoxylon rubiginosum TaxID=110542 RepID=A0ACC0DIW1_9PEZI|nr:hypothetical protein F4821DRAFT_110976 [Hypoxylon rubiginosum]
MRPFRIAHTSHSTCHFTSSTTMAPPTYIISRMGDPIFAVIIGLGAAATRINREQKEKGKTTEQTIEAGKRRFGSLFTSKPAQ